MPIHFKDPKDDDVFHNYLPDSTTAHFNNINKRVNMAIGGYILGSNEIYGQVKAINVLKMRIFGGSADIRVVFIDHFGVGIAKVGH